MDSGKRPEKGVFIMKNTKENADALIGFFYTMCEFYELACQKVMEPLASGKVNFWISNEVPKGTNGQCHTDDHLPHYAGVELSIDYLLNEKTTLTMGKGTILHEVTHAWEHEVDPAFYGKVYDLLHKKEIKAKLYWDPGNILEEPARLASLGYDVREVYLRLINDSRVRRSVEAGTYDFVRVVGAELSRFRELFYRVEYTNKVSLPLDLFRQIL